MIKNQRLQKRNRIVAKAKNPKSGHGRDDLPRFEVGDLVNVQSANAETTWDRAMMRTGTVVAVDNSGVLRIRHHSGSTFTVNPGDEMTEVALSDGDAQIDGRSAREQERRLRQIAVDKQQHWEQQRRADEMALAHAVLSKRGLLASGELCTATSQQGVLLVDAPTVAERSALMRVLYEDPASADLEGTTVLNPMMNYAQTPWPAHQDQALLKMASERLEKGDCCAALVLVKWAAATIDTRKHSLTYLKPRLASRIFKLQVNVNRWMGRHAAYMPLLEAAAAPTRGLESVHEYQRHRRLGTATRRLAFAMCLLSQSGPASPATCHLDFDILRRIMRIVGKLHPSVSEGTNRRVDLE